VHAGQATIVWRHINKRLRVREEQILYRTHSIQKTFYIEHILHTLTWRIDKEVERLRLVDKSPPVRSHIYEHPLLDFPRGLVQRARGRRNLWHGLH
jgi:hypothetical protein